MEAATPQSRGQLDSLPNELLLKIIEQPCLSVSDMISLARTSHRYYKVTISAAYKAHITDELGLASKCCSKDALIQHHGKNVSQSKLTVYPQVYWAVQHGQYATLKRLIDNGVHPDMLHVNGEPINVSDTLVGHDIEYEWEDMDYRGACFTPLALAAYNGEDDMVELLLDHGARIDLKATQLCECCNLLLRCAESLPDRPVFWEDSDRDEEGVYLAWDKYAHDSPWTPLHYAICQGNFSTAKLLLDRGASAHNVGNDGVTALHVATRCNDKKMIDYLLEKNLVDINAQSARGVTALHLAHIGCNASLVEEFLNDHGADINLGYTDESGPWTVFAFACAEEDFDQALHYLRKGADPNFLIEGNHDDTAWTVMGFIYGRTIPVQGETFNSQIELEKAILARFGKEIPSDT